MKKKVIFVSFAIKIKDFEIDEEVGLEALDAEIISSKTTKNQVYNHQDITVFNCQNNGVSVEFQQIVSKPGLRNLGLLKFGTLCNELKELYTAVTRARKKLIIYDQNYQKGKFIKDLWRELDLVEFICDSDFEMDEGSHVV